MVRSKNRSVLATINDLVSNVRFQASKRISSEWPKAERGALATTRMMPSPPSFSTVARQG
jgi:hypothetical protein